MSNLTKKFLSVWMHLGRVIQFSRLGKQNYFFSLVKMNHNTYLAFKETTCWYSKFESFVYRSFFLVHKTSEPVPPRSQPSVALIQIWCTTTTNMQTELQYIACAMWTWNNESIVWWVFVFAIIFGQPIENKYCSEFRLLELVIVHCCVNGL